MTPLMPEVHETLLGAARRRAHPPRARRRVPRRAGLLALVVMLAGGSAIAATQWRPQMGDDHRGHPTVAVAGVPADQVAALGVLRRAQTDADRGPFVEAALRLLGGESTGGVHLGAVRRLAVNPHGALVLVPVQRMGGPDPRSTRRNVLCVMQYVDSNAAGASCGTAAELRAGRIGGAMGEGGPRVIKVGPGGLAGALDRGRVRIYALVPDGVARVEVRLHDGSVHGADVHDNAAQLVVDGGLRAMAGGTDARWLDAAGNEVAKRPLHRRRRSAATPSSTSGRP